MSKIGRNDPCHCKSGLKYKKCCLKKEQVIHPTPLQSIGVLRKDPVNTLEDNGFASRYLFGLTEMRTFICPQDKRLEYDKHFQAVYQNLLEAKLARDLVIDLISTHNKSIESATDVIYTGNQINVDKPIDAKLNMFFKDFFIRGIMTIDSLNAHTRYMGYDTSFLFSDEEKKIKKGLKRFPIPETDPRFLHLKKLIDQTRQGWYTQFKELRRLIEHHGFQLPDVQYHLAGDRVVAHYAKFGDSGTQTIEEVLSICWENLSCLCEEIIVLIISLKLSDEYVVVMIPPGRRDKHIPVKYAVRHRAFPEAPLSHS